MFPWIILLARNLAAQSYGDYRFYKNYGDSFYDYGAGVYHAYNGSSPQADANDGVHTDRGVYLDGASSYVTIHSDHWSTPPTWSAPFELAVFVFVMNNGPLIYRSDANGQRLFWLQVTLDGTVNLLVGDHASQVLKVFSNGPGNFDLNEWNLFHLVVNTVNNGVDYELKINLSTNFIQNNDQGSYQEVETCTTLMGYDNISCFNGIFYALHIYHYNSFNEERIYSDSCTPHLQQCYICPGSTSKCLLYSSDPFVNNDNIFCSSCTNGCLPDMTCLDCPSDSLPICESGTPLPLPSLCDSSCAGCIGPNPQDCTACPSSILHVASPPGECSCINGNPDTTTCGICEADCQTCTVSTLCDVCLDPNAVPLADGSGTCECNPGYFLDSSNNCVSCSASCLTCDSSTTCLSCSDPTAVLDSSSQCSCPLNSTFDGSQCVCNSLYYDSDSSSSLQCDLCFIDCQTCSSPSLCLTCRDPLATPRSSEGCECPANMRIENSMCVCNTGFFMNSSNICEECHEDCERCEDSKICLSCKDSSLSPSSEEGCDCPSDSSLQNGVCLCNTGYFTDSSGGCQPCEENCGSCNETECIECLDRNASVDSEGDCKCPEGSEMVEGQCVCSEGKKWSSSSDKCIQEVTVIDEITKFSDSTATIILSAAGLFAGASTAVLKDPMTLWTLINSVQIFSYIPLHNMNLTDRLELITKSFEITNYIPNIYVVIYGHSDKDLNIDKKKWNDFAQSVSFYENIGECTTALALCMLALGLTSVFYVIFPYWRSGTSKKLSSFKFDAFLRLALELYLVIVYASIVSFSNLCRYSHAGGENVIGSIFFVLCLLTPLATALLLKKLHKQIIEENRNVISSFGTLFEEFYITEEFKSLIFYPCFLLRRLVYMISLFYFYDYPQLQFVIDIMCNLSMILIMLFTIKFRSKTKFLFELLSEIGIFIIMLTLSILNTNLSKSTRDLLEYSIIVLAFAIFGANFLYIVVKTADKILKKCKKGDSSESGEIFPISKSRIPEELEPVHALQRRENTMRDNDLRNEDQTYLNYAPNNLY